MYLYVYSFTVESDHEKLLNLRFGIYAFEEPMYMRLPRFLVKRSWAD